MFLSVNNDFRRAWSPEVNALVERIVMLALELRKTGRWDNATRGRRSAELEQLLEEKKALVKKARATAKQLGSHAGRIRGCLTQLIAAAKDADETTNNSEGDV